MTLNFISTAMFLDNEGETLEYHGVIPFDSVVKIMTTNDL